MRGSTIVIHGTSSNATSEMSRGSLRRRRRSTCHASSASRLLAAKIAVGCSASRSASIRCSESGAWKPIGRISRSSTAAPRVLVSEAVSLQPAGVARPVGVGDEERDAAVPEREQVRGRLAGAALVVEHDGVTIDLREPPVDLDDVDTAAREHRRRGAVRRRDDHPGRAHGEERPRAGELLRPVAVVRDEHHLVVRLPQHLLDAGGEVRVELVAEIRDGDADDPARPLLQRPRRGVRDVAEPIGGLAEPRAGVRRRRSRGR